MTATQLMTQNTSAFLEFFRSKFPIFHLSNVFYLDIKYALNSYLLSNRIKLGEMELDTLTETLISKMVSEGVLKEVSGNTWTLIYPEFRTKTPGKPNIV